MQDRSIMTHGCPVIIAGGGISVLYKNLDL